MSSRAKAEGSRGETLRSHGGIPRLPAALAFSLRMTLFCNRCGLIPVTVFGVDTFLYAWMTMSTLAHWSTAHATVTTTLPANSSANCTRAVNTCRNQLTAEKARPELRHADLSEEQAAMLENLAASDEALSPDRKLAARDLVEKLLAMLKPVERLVIDMLYLQERSVAEVQKLTGWTAATIKVRAFRARQKLRKQIGGLL
ncbi:MAG: hypothetical protein DME29_07255 [Verrucomicrobia bacterium]|nr:MAG: hypothetical protein DME29_07255 [Verrucomicrobiota bacterium]